MPNRPPFRSLLVTIPALVAAVVPAQDGRRDVVPGREFGERKLLSPGLTDAWVVDAEADEMLWCTVDGETFDPVLTFVDADGRELAAHDGPATHSELWRRVPAKGRYELRVTAFGGRGGGHYTFGLQRFRTAPLAAAGGEASCTFPREQWWHYRVAVRAGDVLVPTAVGAGRLTAVFDADRAPLPERFGGYRAKRDGDCFVRVEGGEGQRCQVLTQLARAGEQPFGDRSAERLAPYGLDTWSVRVPGGACIQVDVRMPAAAFGVDIRDRPHADGQPSLVGHGHFDKGGALRRLYFARRDAVVDVTLRDGSGAGGPYELGVRAWGTAVRAGDTVDGHLPLGDGALFHLALTAGEMVELEVASGRFDPKLDLLDPDGNVVVAGVDDRSPLDRTASHRFLVTKPGTWHALVHCCGQASGAFTLRTVTAPLPELVVGAARAVRWGDHVHLTLQRDEVVWLSLRSSAFDAALQVFDPPGDGRFVAEGGGIGTDVLVAYRAAHAGRHTLLVHARDLRQGDAELRVVRP
jgi:hypothetical protein